MCCGDTCTPRSNDDQDKAEQIEFTCLTMSSTLMALSAALFADEMEAKSRARMCKRVGCGGDGVRMQRC